MTQNGNHKLPLEVKKPPLTLLFTWPAEVSSQPSLFMKSVDLTEVDHYENFPVASWLCPPRLRKAVIAVYHFARTADDLADEGDVSPTERLRLLSDFRSELEACAKGLASQANTDAHWRGLFSNLSQTLEEFQIPVQHFHDLLDAFELDVIRTGSEFRYNNRAELLQYCMKSAAPIGRIMMHLFSEHSAHLIQKSDAICCALQLINFWQDIALDIKRQRFYLPIGAQLSEEVSYAKELMISGASLALEVRGRAGWELRAIVQGGLRITEKLSQKDPFVQRPKITKLDYPLMLWRCLFERNFH
jgi:phytoene/squalene synthetase